MVVLRLSRTSSTCSTVLSAFNAAWVRVLIRLRSGPLRTVLSAMTVIITPTEPGKTSAHPRRLAGELGRGRLVEQPQRGLEADSPGGRYRDRWRATGGSGRRLGLPRAGNHQPDLTGSLNGRQCQGDSLWRRFGGVVDCDDHAGGLQDGRGVGKQGVDMALGTHPQQVDIEIRYRLPGCGVGRQ